VRCGKDETTGVRRSLRKFVRLVVVSAVTKVV
jgi:hypothetical protein